MPSTPAPNNHQLEWLHIDDFSPGCYSAGHISTEQPFDSAPMGAAYLPNTFCCASIPGGALAPLPALTGSQLMSSFGNLPGSSTSALVAAFTVTPQIAGGGGYEVVVVFEADDGTSRYVKTYSMIFPGAVLNAITGPTYTGSSMAGYFGAPYPYYTRMNTTGSGTGSSIGPKLVFPTSDDSAHASGHLWVYPSIGTPGSFLADDIVGTSITGQVLTYGNRVIVTAGVNYTWATTTVNTNENFNYTDPPESNAYGNQQTIFSIENPWGYGAYGTVSVGELLLVKKYGGGVVLNGDINVPTSVIRMPGIQPTGDFVGRAGATPIGLVYCSQNRGAWIWNGGNTSQKISRNISDSFFDLETGNLQSNNYGFFVESWQKWILFSNNVIYDTDTGAWWQLYPKHGINPTGLSGRNLFWYALTNNGNQLTAAPLQVTSNSDPVFSIFDNTIPSSAYQWQSLPINVEKHADRFLDIRQIVIRASDPTNTGGASVQVTSNSFNATSTVAIGTEPTTIRFNVGVGAQNIQDVDLTLYCHNSVSNGSAPIIHSIDIGYIVRQGVPVND